MLMGSAVVLTAVVGLWWYALRRRPRSYDDAAAARVARRWILWGGIALPAFGIALLLAFGIPLGHRLLPPTDDREAALHVEVTGHQWWWEVRYSDHDVVTANQLVLPAATPVHVAVTSADVIHSFWVPSLGGKIDMIPGHTNRTRLFAHEPGLHRGQCAEFCGAQHARMILTVEVLTPQDFEAWLAARREPAVLTPVRDTDSGVIEAFRRHCADCHRIAGISEGTGAPDLTDLGSRRFLGAGTLALTPGAARRWLRQHQTLKAGNAMPVHAEVPPDVLDELGDWLETLQP
jgi:cytochrome c oxidase subunit II